VPNKNIVELDLYVRIAKMIVDVKRNYTMMNIKELMKLRRSHSVRMLALLNRISTYKIDEWEIPKRKHMTLEELNAFFGTNYKTWNEFERSLLKPVKEELDAYSKLSFIYEANFEALGRGRPSFRDVTIDLIENQPRLF
jgi:plasmid replication initiation protein